MGRSAVLERVAGDADIAPGWLPPGKHAAVCLSIDDVHPGTSNDSYEAGGDLHAGALGASRSCSAAIRA